MTVTARSSTAKLSGMLSWPQERPSSEGRRASKSCTHTSFSPSTLFPRASGKMTAVGSTLVSPFGMPTSPLTHRTHYLLSLQHRNRPKPPPSQHREAQERATRTRNAEPHPCLAQLLQPRLDRSTGSQYGKAPIIPNTDYTANRSSSWWNSSPYNMKHFDIHLAAYNAELRVLARFRLEIHSDPSNPTGFNKVCGVAYCPWRS